MIKKAEYFDKLSTFDNDVFGCRIISTAEAYGMNEPFAQFWIQDDNTAILKLDDCAVLSIKEQAEADFEELKDFIPMTGATRVLCGLNTSKKLGINVSDYGQIMEYNNSKELQKNLTFEINPSLRKVHELLTECESDTFTPPEFEPFYMDMSHRIRHGTAVSVGMCEDEELVSCALCSAFTQNNAILSAVAVHPKYRLKGLGHKTISELIAQLKQGKIYILREQNENKEFYESFGFVNCGEFAEMTV